jgi:DNA-binding transcriptional ArsR family regulator
LGELVKNELGVRDLAKDGQEGRCRRPTIVGFSGKNGVRARRRRCWRFGMLDDAELANTANRMQAGSNGADLTELLDSAQEASEFLKALAHETRLLILCLLIDGEKSVRELERLLQTRQALVSQQLARLRADDLVEARRDGKNIYYSIARPEVMEIIGALHRAFCRR